MWIGLPLSFVVAVVEAPEFEVHRSPLGRLAFIAGLLVLAIFCHLVLHPRRGLMKVLCEREGDQLVLAAPEHLAFCGHQRRNFAGGTGRNGLLLHRHATRLAIATRPSGY